jgi:N-acetylmuramoyl-L-alanine amidase
MLAILDLQHRGKPGSNDLGASHDLDGDGVVEAMEHEANLTPIYAAAARSKLEAMGAEVLVLDSGWYATRHKAAGKAAAEHAGAAVYVACHLNAGGGDYGLVCHDYRSGRGAGAATEIALKLRKHLAPELRRALVGATAPTTRPTDSTAAAWDALPRYEGALLWPRAWSTLSGIYSGPGNVCGVCFEPAFIDTSAHRGLLTDDGLRRVGDALASGLLSYFATVAGR